MGKEHVCCWVGWLRDGGAHNRIALHFASLIVAMNYATASELLLCKKAIRKQPDWQSYDLRNSLKRKPHVRSIIKVFKHHLPPR